MRGVLFVANGPLDFKGVAAAALAMAPTLLHEWLGGTQRGREWRGTPTSQGGPGDSWAVNLDTGVFSHFAGDEKGGDLIDLYAQFFKVDLKAAFTEVSQRVGINGHVVKTLPPTRSEHAAERIPFDAPDVLPHPKYGAPAAIYRYGNEFVVCRYDFIDGEGTPAKSFSPFTWRGGKWVAKAYPEPRPLYNLADLRKNPDAPVLIVEGEKCAEAARALLRAYVCMTWASGSNAVKKNDWRPLEGRDCLIWPDADEPGTKAAAELARILCGFAKRVRVIVPDKTGGWDIADAIADGWDLKMVVNWASQHLKEIPIQRAAPQEPKTALEAPRAEPGAPAPIPSPKPTPPALPPPTADERVFLTEGDDPSAPISWEALGLEAGQNGLPYPTVANASQILQLHPALKGKIWLDIFRDRIFHNLRGPTLPWTDADTRGLTVKIQQSMHLPKFNPMLVFEAVQHTAECHARNSLTDWLNGLEWDGTERLNDWLADTLGVQRNPYSLAISRNWPIAMVARAYVPGSKVDNMPVLEGPSGLAKTTFLEVLGSPWYKSLPVAFGSKEFLEGIQSAWLIEVPDMTGFSRREHTHILATLTVRNDYYRKSYGRVAEDHPRTAMFAATSETDDYLEDIRGRRRYWPLRCTAIDIEALHRQKEQIFAEAVVRYRAGETWYAMPVESDTEQRERVEPDPWTDRVVDFMNVIWDDFKRGGRVPDISSTDILVRAIDFPLAKIGTAEVKRIRRIMRENNWIIRRTTHGRFWKKVERAENAYAAVRGEREPGSDDDIGD
jgi:putative DNA primase/helicase